jgi:hypothetical protein
MLWILLLAQVGASGSRVIAEDGFAFTADEEAQCSTWLAMLRQLEATRHRRDDLSFRREQFELCVGRVRMAKRLEAEQREENIRRGAEAAAAKREEERRQQERIDHQAAIDAEAEKVATDPKRRRVLLSALLCDQLSAREDLLPSSPRIRSMRRSAERWIWAAGPRYRMIWQRLTTRSVVCAPC